MNRYSVGICEEDGRQETEEWEEPRHSGQFSDRILKIIKGRSPDLLIEINLSKGRAQGRSPDIFSIQLFSVAANVSVSRTFIEAVGETCLCRLGRHERQRRSSIIKGRSPDLLIEINLSKGKTEGRSPDIFSIQLFSVAANVSVSRTFIEAGRERPAFAG